MKNILIINSSISGEKGQSNQLIENFVQALPKPYSLTQIDLNAQTLPHLTMTEIAAWMTPQEQRNAEQAALAAISDQSIAQVQQADLILIGVPMYNFGIPSQLKAWFDRIARAGITFKYTETGPVGLLADKPVILFATRGGIYQDLPADSQTPFLRAFLNFVGLKDLHFVYAEGLNMGPDAAAAALEAAKIRIAGLSVALVA